MTLDSALGFVPRKLSPRIARAWTAQGAQAASGGGRSATLATSCQDGTVRAWSCRTFSCSHVIETHTDQVLSQRTLYDAASSSPFVIWER